jgi:hypothetical protein
VNEIYSAGPELEEQEQRLLSLISDLELFSAQQDLTSKLNIFLVGLDRQEIKHSKFLKFLLTPAAQHGLGDTFLKGIIGKVFQNLQSAPPLRPLAFSLASFEDANVQTEWKDIDILIESRTNRLVLAIENKIDASESKDQLLKYETIVNANYPQYHRLFAYLTPPEGESPSRSQWSSITYADVLNALTAARGKAIASEIHLTIEHYINLLRRNFVPDEELVQQCRQIAAKHRQALDLIYRYGEVNGFSTAANRFFDNHPEFSWNTVKPNRAAFLPKPIYDALPTIQGLSWFDQSRPLLLWFLLESNKLGLIIEVGPFQHPNFPREPLARKLLDHFGTKTKVISPKFTRVRSQYRILSEDQSADVESLLTQMEFLYKDALPHLAIGEMLTDYFKEPGPQVMNSVITTPE